MGKRVVIDLEMCQIHSSIVSKKLGMKNEIIQIGAVLLNDFFDIEDTYMTYVHPEYGYIDSFIKNLTGITSKDVENAPDTASALKSFVEWLPEDAQVVSWSETDKNQISLELNSKNIIIPEFDSIFETWVDCQMSFSEKAGYNRVLKLSEALNIASVEYYEGEHDALIDAKNTALLYAKMEKEDVFKLSPYITGDVPKESRFNPFDGLLV